MILSLQEMIARKQAFGVSGAGVFGSKCCA